MASRQKVLAEVSAERLAVFVRPFNVSVHLPGQTRNKYSRFYRKDLSASAEMDIFYTLTFFFRQKGKDTALGKGFLSAVHSPGMSKFARAAQDIMVCSLSGH